MIETWPTAGEVQALIDRARAVGERCIVDGLLRAQPDWPWREILPGVTGVRWLRLDELLGVGERPAGWPQDQPLFKDSEGDWVCPLADPWHAASTGMLLARFFGVVQPVAVDAATLADLAVPAAGRPQAQDVVTVIEQALSSAWRLGASDVHFECGRHGLTVKLRLDGVMSPLMSSARAGLGEEVISRIKVLSQLDITERRLPQDGRFRLPVSGQDVDVRVSIMPSVFGEDAVLRLLDRSNLRTAEAQVRLDSLGLGQSNASRLRMLANLPHGMLLVTGPTGSGKTTTVYAALSEVNTGIEKIVTIEDPVEYELPGVLQIPVNEKKGLTFARGLRSILRHDPDRILVGEIRDAETAEIAVQAALTGHLVFTTVHANSLFDVVGRFRHFGLDMFGFMSSLHGVVVQRLMRRLCPHCKAPVSLKPAESEWLMRHGLSLSRASAGRGCEACRGTGYRGRFVMAEVHVMTDRVRDRVLAGAEVSELKRLVYSKDDPAEATLPLLLQALAHVEAGDTSLEEVFRVVGQA